MAPARRPYELKRTIGRIAWVSAAVVLLLAVLAFATGRGFTLSSSEGGPSVRVDAPLGGGASAEQIDASQPSLEAERTEALDDMSDETSVAAVDLAGEWFGDSSGGTYLIDQVGGAATITEFDAFGNITAVGQGTLSGRTFSFTYDSAAGFSGVGELTLDDSGRFLNGFWEDSAFGRRPAQLSRF